MRGRVLRAGVIGAGVFGGHHAAKYANAPHVDLTAIFDCDPSRAGALADRHGATAFVTVEDFLDAVDVVTVATPATHHFDYAARALSAGRHVLVEKPLALSAEEADILVEAASRRGLVLQVGHQERFIADGLGLFDVEDAPRLIRCRRVTPRSGRGEDVSVVMDLMIHDLDLVSRLPLGPLLTVTASGDQDDVEAELVFACGARAVLTASRSAPVSDRRMSLDYGDEVVSLDFVAREMTGRRASRAKHAPAPMSDAFKDPLGFGVSRFVAAVRKQDVCPIPGVQVRRAVDWASRIEAAAFVPTRELVRAAS